MFSESSRRADIPPTASTGTVIAIPLPGMFSPISVTQRRISRFPPALSVMNRIRVFSFLSRPMRASMPGLAVPLHGKLKSVLTPASRRKSVYPSVSSRGRIRIIRFIALMLHPLHQFNDLFTRCLRLRRGGT